MEITVDKDLAWEVIRLTPDLASELDGKTDVNLFTERWIVREDYIERQDHWLQSTPQNSEAAGTLTRRIFALKPRVGSELIQVRINVSCTAYLIQIAPTEKRVVHWERFDYENIERFIQGSATITDIFGYWPSFHDAEVLKLSLERGEITPEKNVWVMPILTVTIEHWEMTDEVNAAGYFVLKKRRISTLKFDDVRGFQMNGFNHQNALYGLDIERIQKDGVDLFYVNFHSAYGMEASFECSSIEVLESHAKPECDETIG